MYDGHYDLLTYIFKKRKNLRIVKGYCDNIFKHGINGGIFNLFYMSEEEMKEEAEAKRIEAHALAYHYDQLARNIEVQTTLTELEIDAERAERWDGREIPNYIPLTVAGSPVVMGN